MDHTDKIDQIVSQLLEVSHGYLDQTKTQSLTTEYKNKKSESTLQVMLFGSYNAGKSSLINALLKKEEAAVDDIPTTAIAKRYIGNGCYLLDTPGVNAPIEHEALTEEQVNRSELILFVISEGDQDVRDVYERMFGMLVRSKHIFIVYNHELSQEELPEALVNLNKIMASYTGNYDVPLQRVAEIPVIPINVKSAITARLTGSEALAEHSGIVNFESTFHSWLRRFDSEHHYLDRLRKYIQQCVVAPILAEIDQKKQADDNDALENLHYQREEITRQYDLLESQVANHVRGEIVRLKPEIAALLDHCSKPLELDAGIHQLASQVAQSTTDFLQQRCDGIIAELSTAVDYHPDMPSDEEAKSKVAEVVQETMLSGVKRLDKKHIKDGLLVLRKMKVPFVKGRWEKTLGKWATKANFAIQAAVIAVELWMAKAGQDKQNEEKRRRTLTVSQAVESVANEISAVILDETSKHIKSTKQQSVGALNSRIEQLVENSEQHTKDRERVKLLATELEAVHV